jgi:tRNA (mo5U34)-methyltransferase
MLSFPPARNKRPIHESLERSTLIMNADDIRRGAEQFDWYHTIDLGHGIVTKGVYDHRPLLKHYGIPDDLSGKTVLDAGPAHGFFAFEFEKRGAERVVTVELPRWSDHDGSPQLKQSWHDAGLDTTLEPYMRGALAFAIEARNSKVEQLFHNIYDLSPELVGTYDYTFCGSVLLHLTDPLRALYALRSVTRHCAIVATTVLPDLFGGRKARAEFRGATPTAHHVFWAPNMRCLEKWALAAGFSRVERVSTFYLNSLDGTLSSLHGTIKAYVG